MAALTTLEGQPLEVTLTTNGSLLQRQARSLKNAGLSRLSISLDSLDDATFRRMNDVDFPVAKVLDGIAAAQAAGFERIKVNMVVKRSTNAHDILPMAAHFRGTGVTLRFIEYMDVGATNGWCMDEVVPSAEIITRLQAQFPLVPLEPSAPGETAQRWGYANAQGQHDPALGEVGVISSVTQAFSWQLQPCPPLDRGAALPVLVRPPGLGFAQPAAQWQQRCRHQRPHRPDSGPAHRPLFRTAHPRPGSRKPRQCTQPANHHGTAQTH